MASGKSSQNIMIQNQMNQEKFPGATSLQQQALDFDDEGTTSKGLNQTELQKKKNADRIQKNAEVIVRKKGSRQASAKRSEAGGDAKSTKGLDRENISPARPEDEVRSETIKDFKEFNFESDNIMDQRTLDPLMPGRLDEYKGEEENLVCCRFPHLDFDPMPIDVNEIRPVEVYENIFLGPFQAALCTKTLLSLGITHVLNVSAMEYTKRTNYYNYLTLDVYDVQEEDIKKFFRITNRFISEVKLIVYGNDKTEIGFEQRRQDINPLTTRRPQ